MRDFEEGIACVMSGLLRRNSKRSGSIRARGASVGRVLKLVNQKVACVPLECGKVSFSFGARLRMGCGRSVKMGDRVPSTRHPGAFWADIVEHRINRQSAPRAHHLPHGLQSHLAGATAWRVKNEPDTAQERHDQPAEDDAIE